jgi:hypothetical protein
MFLQKVKYILGFESESVSNKSPRGGSRQTPTVDKRPVCHQCGKVGHIKRNCFVRRNVTTHAVQEKPSS